MYFCAFYTVSAYGLKTAQLELLKLRMQELLESYQVEGKVVLELAVAEIEGGN